MHFRPLHDRVLVRRIDAEEKTAGGIIIPDTAKEKPQEGEIVAAGPGGRNEQGQLIPIDVKPGDRVLFGKWSGTEVKIDGQDYLIMKDHVLLDQFLQRLDPEGRQASCERVLQVPNSGIVLHQPAISAQAK
jgi:chaperonin GroES